MSMVIKAKIKRRDNSAFRVFLSVVATPDKIVYGYAEENAKFNQRVVVGLVSAHFPA